MALHGETFRVMKDIFGVAAATDMKTHLEGTISTITDTLTLSSAILDFTGASGGSVIQVADNAADALSVKISGSEDLFVVDTTNDAERITFSTGITITPAEKGATDSGGTVLINGGIGGVTSGAGGVVTITGGAGQTNAAGGTASLIGGAGQGTGAGATAVVRAGASGAGATGNGGAASVTGGAAASTNGTGGAASLVGGLGTGTGAGGAITITSGAAGSTGVAGAVAVSVGAATAGNGSSMTLTGGNGAGGTASGGNVNIVPGTAVSTGVPGEVMVNSAAGLFTASFILPLGVSAPTTDQAFFVAPRACRIVGIKCVYSAAQGGAATAHVEKDTGTTAPGAGTTVMTGTFDLNTTVNTVQSATLSTTVATITLAAGDRLSVDFSTTVGSLVGLVITVLLNPC